MKIFREIADNIYTEAKNEGRLTDNPSVKELKTLAKDAKITSFGSQSFISKIRSRSAKFTKTVIDNGMEPEDLAVLAKVKEYVADKRLVSVDRWMGEHPFGKMHCRLVVSEKYARISLGWGEMLNDFDGSREPDIVSIYVPEWEETKILVDTDAGVTFILGTDYIGEAKKSFLRMWMRRVKEKGALGLHAGSKLVRVNDKEFGQLYLGLSATGKSTLTGHGFGFPSGALLYQDDVGALLDDGTFIGTEGKGLYVKTDGLNAADQPEIYGATTTKDAILENVFVAEDGSVDFYDSSLTSNGRAVILRKDMPNVSNSIDLPKVNQIFFLTRNPLAPPAAKLNNLQAAAAFMLGESIETSAGDPSKAGQYIRCVGTNPFIVGPKGEEGNMFLDILGRLPYVESYVLNTGGLGEGEKFVKVKLRDTVAILRGIVLGTVTWKPDPEWGYEVIDAVPDVDMARFDLSKIYSKEEYKEKLAKLHAERRAWLAKFPELKEEIRNVY